MDTADKGTRLGNYIIDNVCFIVVIIIHAVVLDSVLHIIPEYGSPLLGIYYFILYFSYHFLFEYFFSRTPGKFITKTIVVNKYGEKPNLKSLFIRNLCRIIPIDAFSFLFGSGLHDTISRTNVISSK
jgi:uncharacterized RDD family membrane protein YckC